MEDYSAFKIVEYTVQDQGTAELAGTRIDQENVLACASRDGFFAYFHVSKEQFRPEEAILLQKVLSTVSLIPTGPDRSISKRWFPVPGHDFLQLPLPSNWRTSMRLPSLTLPPTIEFRGLRANDFEVLITVLWNKPGGRLNSLGDIRAAVEQSGAELLPAAVQDSLILEEISGPHLTGYLYSLAKRQASSSEFKYFKQGIAKTGDLILTFTISAHDQNADVFGVALETLRNAQQTPAASVAALPLNNTLLATTILSPPIRNFGSIPGA